MKKNYLLAALLAAGGLLTAQSPRLSLYEEFTGETCPPCAAANPALNQLLAQPTNTAKIVAIKWQVPIPTAPTNTWSLYQTNKAEIDWRWHPNGYGYNPPIVSAPYGKIDGQEASTFGAFTEHPMHMTSAVIATAQSYTSAFSISMNRAWNYNSTAVTLTITITATAPFTSVGNLVFRTVMVERLIQFPVQPGTNGEKTFHDVAIKSFPTLKAGVPMASTWIVGQTQTFTLNCPLPSYTRKKEQIAFVGFIQDDGNQTVAQAARADKAPMPQDAVSGIASHVDLTCSNLITPTVEVKNMGAVNPITNLTLTPYINGSAGTPYAWSGNIAPGAIAAISLGTVSTPVLSGSHSFSCDIQLASPLYDLVGNATRVEYMVAATSLGTPVSEGFSGNAYPPAGFCVINKDKGPGWSRSTKAGGYSLSLESTKYDFYNNTVIGDQDELYLPPMDLSTATGAMLAFDIAYAQRNDAASEDALDVMASDDCGATWTNVYHQQGVGLSTTWKETYAYTPDLVHPEWRTESADLSAFDTRPDVLLKFVTTSDNGNNLYIDNINMVLSTAELAKASAPALRARVFPNPANELATLSVYVTRPGEADISVTNQLGQVVIDKKHQLNAGANTIQLSLKDLPCAIYNVSVSTAEGAVVKKLTVLN